MTPVFVGLFLVGGVAYWKSDSTIPTLIGRALYALARLTFSLAVGYDNFLAGFRGAHRDSVTPIHLYPNQQLKGQTTT